jgi:hypothetical protein
MDPNLNGPLWDRGRLGLGGGSDCWGCARYILALTPSGYSLLVCWQPWGGQLFSAPCSTSAQTHSNGASRPWTKHVKSWPKTNLSSFKLSLSCFHIFCSDQKSDKYTSDVCTVITFSCLPTDNLCGAPNLSRNLEMEEMIVKKFICVNSTMGRHKNYPHL